MRLFVGCPVPPGPAFEAVGSELAATVPGVKRVPPGTWHVTMRFLGDIDDPEPVRQALAAALKTAAALPVRVASVGAFKDARHARVVWAGVEAPGIEALADAIVTATQHVGKPPDRRDFRAHVTLARMREPHDVRSLVARHAETLFAEGVLDRVVLYRSTLGPQGPHYEAEAVFPLKPSS